MPQTPSTIGLRQSTNLENTPLNVPDLSTCPNNSKNREMAILENQIQPPLETSYRRQRQDQFMLHEIAPAQKNARSWKGEVDKLLAMKFIEPCQTVWASPVVFVPKKVETLRFCVDYHKVNAVCTRDCCLLPRMCEYIDFLRDAIIFCTLY